MAQIAVYDDPNPGDVPREFLVMDAHARTTMAIGCTTDDQKTVLAMPSYDVHCIKNRINPAQFFVRPSYLNAVLIQSRGWQNSEPCLDCSRRGSAPFVQCISLPGSWGGCCGSCKYADHAARCTLYNNDYDETYEVPSDDGSSVGDEGSLDGMTPSEVGDLATDRAANGPGPALKKK